MLAAADEQQAVGLDEVGRRERQAAFPNIRSNGLIVHIGQFVNHSDCETWSSASMAYSSDKGLGWPTGSIRASRRHAAPLQGGG